MMMAGTAGTGKTFVINEMVRVVGPDKFQLLAPTGNVACGIGGQVRYTLPLTCGQVVQIHASCYDRGAPIFSSGS